MAYTISELQIVGVQSTLDLSDIIPPLEGCLPMYGAINTNNVGIISIVGSIVTYVALSAGTFEFAAFNGCYGEGSTAVQVEGNAVVFQATVSAASDIYNFTPCCNDCYNPIIVSDLYEGDTYIPFSLDMEDGTIVATMGGSQGKVLDGRGVVELSTPLVAGSEIQLQVLSDTCKAVSSVSVVKVVAEDCDSCPDPNKCHIRLLSVSVKYEGINSVSVSSLTN